MRWCSCLAAALLFGASSPFSKLLLGNFDPIVLAGFLYLGSGVSARLFFILKGGAKTQSSEACLTRSDLPWLGSPVWCCASRQHKYLGPLFAADRLQLAGFAKILTLTWFKPF